MKQKGIGIFKGFKPSKYDGMLLLLYSNRLEELEKILLKNQEVYKI